MRLGDNADANLQIDLEFAKEGPLAVCAESIGIKVVQVELRVGEKYFLRPEQYGIVR